jgi:3,4-dihydroxy-2-butanone 4-phosphate synthase
MVIVVDDDGDSATGDLVLAAEFAESDAINQHDASRAWHDVRGPDPRAGG